jgi:putative restriction endonuclease
VLLALGRLATTGSSELPWTEAETKLADLVAEFGPPSRTSRAQNAAYPFTRLRVDGVWELDQDMPMDPVGPLGRRHVTGRLEASAESALLAKPAVIAAVARDLVLNNFPATVAPDVLQAVGLDPQEALAASDLLPTPPGGPGERTRDPGGGLPFWSLGPAVRILRL